jgi:hypothetical protein
MALTPLSDEDRARMLAEAEEMRAARSEHLRRVEARRVGVAVLVTVGCQIYSRQRLDIDELDERPARGGVIVAIGEGERDADTGFIPRRFTILDPTAHPSRWEHVIDEGDVDFELTVAANDNQLVNLITRLQREGGKRKGSVLTPREGRWIEHERALKSVVLP